MNPHIDIQNTPTAALARSGHSMPCVYVATRAQQQLARIVARMRTQGHDGNRKPEADLGAIGNDEADFWGVLAEIVVIDRLERAGHAPQHYVFYADRSPVGPDFVLHGVRWNVKAIPPSKHYLSVNERQRRDPRHEADFVLPVRFLHGDSVALLSPVSYTRIAEWPLRQGRSAYRSVSVDTLPVIENLLDVAAPNRRKV